MSAERPWFKEPWPWLLMSGPAAVVLAGGLTAWLAFAGADGLVADDYYKRGLTVNRVLAREEAARTLGISAETRIAGGTIVVRLAGDKPEALFVHLAHATRAGHDLRLRLAPAGKGRYAAELPELAPGRWQIVIEDPRGRWRITKEGS